MFALFATLLVALDQATKWWAKGAFEAGGSLPVGLGFNFTFVRNTGAAFGIFRNVELSFLGFTIDGTFLLGLLSAAVSLVLLIYLLRKGPYLSFLPRFSLTLVLAGAVGNMIDRFALGYVIDFIHFRVGWFDFPVFNLADTFVVTGGILLFLAGLFEGSQAGSSSSAEASTGPASGERARRGEESSS